MLPSVEMSTIQQHWKWIKIILNEHILRSETLWLILISFRQETLFWVLLLKQFKLIFLLNSYFDHHKLALISFTNVKPIFYQIINCKSLLNVLKQCRNSEIYTMEIK